MKVLVVRKQNDTVKSDVDDDVFEWAKSYCWRINKDGYVSRRTHGTELLLHRLVIDATFGTHTDHINRDKLDNRRVNLRPITQQGNQRNQGLLSKNTSGFKGVYGRRGKWRSCYQIKRVTVSLGTFDTAREAALAYDAAVSVIDPDWTTNAMLGLL